MDYSDMRKICKESICAYQSVRDRLKHKIVLPKRKEYIEDCNNRIRFYGIILEWINKFEEDESYHTR